ncbi:MAG TPA: competence/damage-inducible protein A [Gemmatimonadaceae bacterium]
MLQVEILTIGDELLLGYTVDTNAAYLARALADAGIIVSRRATVGDDATEIARAVAEALDRTGAVITTGGLGPTADDRTRPAIAALFGRELRRDEGIVARLEARFREMGYASMPPANLVQAMVPEGARLLANGHGTAPGLWLEDARGRWVAMLPGVPREMRGMLADTLLPLLHERAGGEEGVVLSRTLRTTGIGESALAEHLGDLAAGVNGLPLAFLPGWEGVDLRVTARGMPRADAERALEEAVSMLRERVGHRAYGEIGTDLAAVVLDACRAGGVRVATAESCTGGMLGARLTAIAGSSDVYVGGVVAYDNSIKERLLGVDARLLREHGAVSEPVALAMARGARERTGAEIAISITGVAGPGGGSAEKPVGTVWIAVVAPAGERASRRVFPGDREEIRRRATQGALDMVRRTLQPTL